MSFVQNRLLLLVTLTLAAYWSLGWYIPGALLSITLSVFSVLVGVAIIFRYFQGVYGVLIRRERSEDGDGAYLAAIGIPSIAASIVYGGMFNLGWIIAGTPDDWLGTPASNFSRLLMVGGCVALYLTPDVQRERFSIPSLIWLSILMVTAVVTAFVLGAFVGNECLFDIRPVSYPDCRTEKPVWVANNSRYFHTEDSPWRAEVVPRRCYKTVEEAQKAGFRPVPVLTSRNWK